MNKETSPEDFYKQQQDIQNAVERLPDTLDEKMAEKLSVHEARLGERIDTLEKSLIGMSFIAVVLTAAIVVAVFYVI